MVIVKTLFMFATLVAMILALGGCQWARSSSAGIPGEPGTFRHVVVFKFVDVPDSTVREIESAFAALPGKIKEIRSYEWGRLDSIEGLDQGYTHGFSLGFDSKADCRIYLDHPDHQAFVAKVKPLVKAKKLEVFVFDYEVR